AVDGDAHVDRPGRRRRGGLEVPRALEPADRVEQGLEDLLLPDPPHHVAGHQPPLDEHLAQRRGAGGRRLVRQRGVEVGAVEAPRADQP
ncbi:hypothetical protein DF186_17695, partial [Enterococcus hirae]